MAAHNSLNPNQLKMFMSAHEIKGEYQPLDGDRSGYETDDEVWERKLDEATNNRTHWDDDEGVLTRYPATQTEHIRQHGVTQPVHLGSGNSWGDSNKRQVAGGHHRIAVMGHLNPDQLMPVLHHTGFHAAISDQTNQAYPYS